MQINPFGFPLGAGMPAPAMNGAGLGFADALGLATEGGVAPQLTGLVASAPPPKNFDPKLARLLAQAQLDAQAQPLPAAAALPGLQQPTSLSELMATAAKLPGAEQVPVAAPVEAEADPSAAVPEIPAPAADPAVLTPAIPLQNQAALQPDEALPDAPAFAPPAETTPAKPQKGARGRAVTADADPAPSDAAKSVVPAAMLAVNAVPQPVAPPQSAPREPSANAQGGAAVSKPGKVAAQAALAPDTTQAAPATGTADFARAIAAKGDSTGSEAKGDGQPQPEITLAATPKTDAAAPILPQHAQATTSTSAAPVAAHTAEPVIEARPGHLGHSLGVEIARKVELGEDTLRIRLNPIELGRIEVTLAFDDKGSLQATVRTESAQAMDLLRQDAPDLARTLDQAGVRTDAQSFRFENRGGDSGGQQAQQQHNQNRGQFASSDDDAAVAEPIYRPIRSDGQVDLLA